MHNRLHRWLIISCIALITTACGGGGGSGGSNSGSGSGTTSGSPSSAPNTPSSSPSTSPTPSAPATVNRSVRLSWTIPAVRTDGSPLAASAITGYRLFYTRDGSATSEDTIVYIGNGATTQTNISLALTGTYTFAITAIDLSGIESSLSTPVSITIN